MSESDFNPLIFKKPLSENEENFSTIADGNLDTGDLQVPVVTQAVDNLFAQYQQLQAQNEQLQDKFFALADVMYQMLAFINAQRLYQNRPAIMANDIANIIENNLVLAEITTHLRESAITSTLGIISQFDEAQEYLRQHVMQAWKERFAGEERQKLGEKLLGINAQESSNSKATENAPNGETPASKEQTATETTAHSEDNPAITEQTEEATHSEENSAIAEKEEEATHSEENPAIAEQAEETTHSEENSAIAEKEEEATHSEENPAIAEQAEEAAHSEENSAIDKQADTAVQSEENSAIVGQAEASVQSEENSAITEQAEATAHSEEHLATAQHTENSPISEQATHSAITPPIDSTLISHETNIDDELIEQEVTITEADINQMQIEVHNDDLEDINYLKNQSYKVRDHNIDAEDFFDEAVD